MNVLVATVVGSPMDACGVDELDAPKLLFQLRISQSPRAYAAALNYSTELAVAESMLCALAVDRDEAIAELSSWPGPPRDAVWRYACRNYSSLAFQVHASQGPRWESTGLN